jgi:hypothetical protein
MSQSATSEFVFFDSGVHGPMGRDRHRVAGPGLLSMTMRSVARGRSGRGDGRLTWGALVEYSVREAIN